MGRKMPKFEEQVQRFVQALKLRKMPVGVRFSDNPDRKGVERKLRICEALDIVRQENVVVNLSEKNCTCRVGCHMAGWQTLPPEELPAIFLTSKAYESKEVAEASVSKQPRPKYRGKFLILGPLDKFKTDPDAVLFFVNAAQADRILGMISYRGAEPFVYYPVTTTCSAITFTLAKGKPEINFISVFERRRRKWSPNELIIALPFKEFMVAVESISYSTFGRLLLSK